MTDPNLPPITPPPAYQTPAAAVPTYIQNIPSPPPYSQQVRPDKYNVLAIVSLVSAFFVPVVPIITGHMALYQIKMTREQGFGLAIAGLVLGYLAILVIVVVILMAIPILFTVFSTFFIVFNGY